MRLRSAFITTRIDCAGYRELSDVGRHAGRARFQPAWVVPPHGPSSRPATLRARRDLPNARLSLLWACGASSPTMPPPAASCVASRGTAWTQALELELEHPRRRPKVRLAGAEIQLLCAIARWPPFRRKRPRVVLPSPPQSVGTLGRQMLVSPRPRAWGVSGPRRRRWWAICGPRSPSPSTPRAARRSPL